MMTRDMTLAELATITRRNVESLRMLARVGRLPGVYRLGNRWLISEENVRRLRRVRERGSADAD